MRKRKLQPGQAEIPHEFVLVLGLDVPEGLDLAGQAVLLGDAPGQRWARVGFHVWGVLLRIFMIGVKTLLQWGLIAGG